jgi:uncharacterized protein
MEEFLIVKDSQIGKGLFTMKSIPAGKTILKIKGKRISWPQAKKIWKTDPKVGDNLFRFGPETFINPAGEVGNYLNHSCDPNCGLYKQNSTLFLFALKPIAANSELTFDYSTIIAADDIWTMKCRCGNKNCRKTIKSFDTLPDKLQNKYKEMNAVPQFILNTL